MYEEKQSKSAVVSNPSTLTSTGILTCGTLGGSQRCQRDPGIALARIFHPLAITNLQGC